MQKLCKVIMIGIFIGQFLSTGCTSRTTISSVPYGPFHQSRPITSDALQKIKEDSPKDVVFADLLQAFALMRTVDLTKQVNRKEILNLLTSSVASFEDMRDPKNFSKAFSADESKRFIGAPHERVMTGVFAAAFLMGEGQYSLALPYLYNAEFMGGSFHKMPFNTDDTLIYSMIYRCLKQRGAQEKELNRSRDGIFRSVRYLTLQEPLLEALVKLAEIDMRPMAISNRLAFMIYEISLYHSLMSAPNNATVDQLLDDTAKNSALFTSTLATHFENEFQSRIKPKIDELAKVYRINNKDGRKYLENLAFDQVAIEARSISEKLQIIVNKDKNIHQKIREAEQQTRTLSDQIIKAASADKMMLSFTGYGPTLARLGSYQEISMIKPSADANMSPRIRQREMSLPTDCGFHRLSDGNFSLVLCQPDAVKNNTNVEVMPNLEVLSLSRKATHVQGRKFDRILQGRAQFRAATETISEVTAWSAFFLFILGSQIMDECSRYNQGEACYARGFIVWAVAGITAIFSGTVWLIGKTQNPAADSRFIHLMYESGWLAIPRSAQ